MKISSSFSLFRASCRIRTNDPEITNHVLWPTELKRRGWVSLLYRAATTNYLCCDQALEDSSGEIHALPVRIENTFPTITFYSPDYRSTLFRIHICQKVQRTAL